MLIPAGSLSLSLSALLISLTLCNCSDSGSINKLKAQCLLLLLAFFICRWRAVVDDDCAVAVADAAALLIFFLLFLTFCTSSFIMSAQLCTQQRRRLSDLKHAHLLLSLSLSLVCCSAALSQLLRSLAYCIRLAAAQSAHLFIVCCSYDLRFSCCCCCPSLFSRSLPDYRWPHGSRRRAQLRHLLEFHSTCLRVSLGLSSLSLSQSLSRLPSPLPSLPSCECDDARLRPFCDFNSFVLFQFCEPRIANEQNV